MGENVGGWERNENFWFEAQANEQFQTMEVPHPQMGQEVGEEVKKAVQTVIPEVVGAVRLQCAQEFRAFIPELVEAVRSQCAQEFKAFIPILIEEVKKTVHSSGSRSLPHQAESSASRSFQLHFVGNLPDQLVTRNDIQEEGASLMVELRDISGSRVEVGPESAMKIKIVALDGDFEVGVRDDWTEEDFNKNVAKPRKGKAELLKGNCEISLRKGVGIVDNIAFTDNSSKATKNDSFRLGAQVVKGHPHGGVREAVSKRFKVKECRGQSYQKAIIPSLEDHIWRLLNISVKGPIRQRLAEKGIHKVKDFLQLYNTDEMELQDIADSPGKKWRETVNHAKSCLLSNELYRYYDDEAGVDLVLDCVFNIVSVTLNGQSSQDYDILGYSHKELVNKLRRKAYEKRSQLPKACDQTNEISLQVKPVWTSNISHRNMQYASAGEPDMLPGYAPTVNVMAAQPEQPIDQTQDSCLDPVNLEVIFASLISDDFNPHMASTSNTHGVNVIHRPHELMTRCSRWNSVRAVVVMFRIAIKLSVRRAPPSPRALKRQKLA